MEKAGQIRREKLESSGNSGQKVVENLSIYGEGDQIIFAKAYYPEQKQLEDVIIHKRNSDQVVTRKVNVGLARWQDSGFWLGTDVIVFDAGPRGDFTVEPEIYKSRKLGIKETPEDLINTQWDPKMMSYHQLKRYISVISVGRSASFRRLLVDLNYKLAFPFTAMVTVLVGIPFSIATGRVNALMGMARGISIAVLYIPIMAVSLALGKSGTFPPVVSAWLGIILFSFLGIHFINKRS